MRPTGHTQAPKASRATGDKSHPADRIVRGQRSNAARIFAPALGLLFLLASPSAQAATSGGLPTSLGWVVGAFGIVVALIAFFFVMSQSRRIRRMRLSHQEVVQSSTTIFEALEIGRAATVTWMPNGSTAVSPSLAALLEIETDQPIGWDDVLAKIDEAGRAELIANVERLKLDRTPFSTIARSEDGRRYFQMVSGSGSPESGASVLLWIQDISDRATALMHLERESRRLRALLDMVPVPIWSRDKELNVVDCNLAYAEAVEAEARETVLAEAREFAEGDTARQAKALAQKAVQDGVAMRDSHHIVVNGDRRRYKLHEIPRPNGTTTGFALDQTETETLREELARHDSAQEKTLDRLAVAIMIFGEDQRLRFANGACVNMWELEEAWIGTKPEIVEVLDVLHDKRLVPETGDFAGYKREWQGFFTSLIEPREELVHLPNNTAVWMVISPHPNGGLFVTFEDVTDKLKLERSYNTLVDVQLATLNNLSEGVAVFGEDGNLKLSNPVFREMWGLTDSYISEHSHLSDLLEVSKDRFNYGADWPRFKKAYLARIYARVVRNGRLHNTLGRVIAYSIVPMPDGGVLLSFRDITDSTRVEVALRERNDALEAADRLRSEFVANVSYELRSPLTAIIGFTEILNNQYFGEMNQKQRDYITGIMDASHRLQALINDILDLAVIEAGRMVLEIQQVEVSTVLDKIVDMTRDWIGERSLTVSVDCPPDVPAIEADARRLRQILYNLLVNAISYSTEGGQILLSAEQVGEYVAISVVDSGPGIDGPAQEKVFDSFVRGEVGADGRQGAGLGLALVKRFVELHGGRVQMFSESQRGTRVTCFLPIGREVTSPPPYGREALPGAGANPSRLLNAPNVAAPSVD